MGYQQNLCSVSSVAVWLCVQFVTFSLVMPFRAQSLEVSVTFPPTDKRGAPARTVGTGQRTTEACLRGKYPYVTALTPSNNVVTTVSTNPTLFWYFPRTKLKSARLIVLDAQNKKLVYQTTLALGDTPGVVKVNLPKSVSLETGKNYLWNLFVVCNPAKVADDLVVQGWLERTELSSEQKTKLAQAQDPLKQAEVYAEAKIWQETLMILAQLQQERPNDAKVTDAWKELLNSVGLSAIATEPVVECCTVEPSPK